MSVRQDPHSAHPITIRFPIVLRDTIVQQTTQVPMYRHRVGRGHARREHRLQHRVSARLCAALRWGLGGYIVGNCLTTLTKSSFKEGDTPCCERERSREKDRSRGTQKSWVKRANIAARDGLCFNAINSCLGACVDRLSTRRACNASVHCIISNMYCMFLPLPIGRAMARDDKVCNNSAPDGDGLDAS